MRFFQIKDNLFLVEQKIETDVTPKTKENCNHIWLYDRSGSMYNELDKVAQDLKDKSKQIPHGDTISLGWFSGEGQFNFILKGFKVTSDSDFSILDKIIDKNKTTLTTTCFSEILHDTSKVIEDLSVFSERFSVMFMTDGYPIVSNYSKEIESIFEAISKIEGKVTSSYMIGYGNYYNRDLMLDMAERLGGSLIHSQNLPQFSIALQDLIEKSSDSQPKLKVEFKTVKPNKGVIFSLAGNSLNTYKQKEDDSIGFTPNAENNFVYFLTDKITSGMEEVTINENDILRPSKKSSIISALYGAACLLNQKTKTDLAIDTIASLGDKHFVDLLTNAFTNSEHGLAEAELREAMVDTQKRIPSGYDTKYLPPEDSFCLLDLLETLMRDSESYFYPYNPNFKYNRIGTKTVTIGKFPEFKPEDNVKCSFGDLSWNKTMLNLSLLAKIKGTVNLKTGYKALGLNKTYPTIIFRNYTIVKDGLLNMATLPVSMSETSLKKLQSQGILTGYKFEKDHIYDLPLNTIPVMNRSIAKNNTSATDLAEKSVKLIQLEGIMKVLKNYAEELELATGSKSESFKGLSDEQVNFLEENGITKNGFSPKTEKADAVDFYMAKEFSIDIKGCSSLPKVSDVKAKIATGKNLTTSQLLLKAGLDLIDANPTKTSSDSVKLSWVEDLIQQTKAEQLKTRFKIQKTKFAVLLGKQWFDEFDSRENCSLDVSGYTVTFKVEEKSVAL